MKTKPHHFVGYWGYGLEAELNQLLAKLVAQPYKAISKSFLNKENKNKFNLRANIAYLENTIKTQIKLKNQTFTTIAAISASGICNSPDIWVKILQDGSLVLGRDTFGRVPLYWTQQKKIIWFASKLQLLLPVIKHPQVNLAGFYGYNCFSYVPTPLTPVKKIHSVTAGTEITWNSHTLTNKLQPIHQWRESDIQIKDETRAISELQTLLRGAIESQITDLTDEPVGVFLSGGLDSSIVAALLVKAGVKVRAYTLDFGSAGISEYPYAEQTANFLQIPLVKVKATPQEIKPALIPTVQALDLPFGDGVTVPLYLLSQIASQETKVIFNGEGGDQLFAGWTNKPLIAASIYNSETFIQQYLHTFHRLWSYEAQVYQPQVFTQVNNLQPEQWLKSALDAEFCQSLLHRLRRATLMLKGAQNIHPRATNLAFANGLWVRSPFCDLSMAEWTFQLSGELCLQGSCEKYILKRAVENWLPPEIVWRQKRGMGVPLTSWCLNEFWFQLGTWLNPGMLRDEKRFDPNIAAKIIMGELGISIRNRRIGEILWLIIMWELWRIHILGATPAKYSWKHPFYFPRWLWKKYRVFFD